MRKFLISVVLLLAVGSTSGARAQVLEMNLPAVQGQGGTISWILPAPSSPLTHLFAWDISIAYSSDVFEPLGPASFSSPYAFNFNSDINGGGVGLTGPIDGLTIHNYFGSERDAPLPPNDLQLLNPPTNYHQVTVLMTGAENNSILPLTFSGGKLVEVQLKLRDGAQLGETKVFFGGNYAFSDASFMQFEEYQFNATAVTNVTAVPEPETWAMMFAGLTLVGAAVARARRLT